MSLLSEQNEFRKQNPYPQDKEALRAEEFAIKWTMIIFTIVLICVLTLKYY